MNMNQSAKILSEKHELFVMIFYQTLSMVFHFSIFQYDLAMYLPILVR